MSSQSFKQMKIGEMEQIWGGFQTRARASLGVESFGLGVVSMPPNFDLMPPHVHDFDGQEEVYVPLRGSGEIVFGDGGRIEIDDDTAVRVGPDVARSLVAGPDGMQVLIAGGTPGKPYEPFEHSALGTPEPNPAELAGVVSAAAGAGTESGDYAILRLAEMTENVYRGEVNTFHAVGRALGTEAFGIGIVDLTEPEGENTYPLHDHTEDGQTEVFVIQRGAGTMIVGDETIDVEAGEMIAVAPELPRQLQGGPSGMRVVAIGA